MTRLIDADALVSMEATRKKGCAYIEEINNAPTIDAEPIRRAQWLKREYWSEGIGMGETYGHYYECSACGERIKGYDTYLDKYCRKCGAKMERERTNEKLVCYDHEPKTENCNTCKNYALCGTTCGCKKKYEEHRGWFIAWPYTAWCEDWEAKND